MPLDRIARHPDVVRACRDLAQPGADVDALDDPAAGGIDVHDLPCDAGRHPDAARTDGDAVSTAADRDPPERRGRCAGSSLTSTSCMASVIQIAPAPTAILCGAIGSGMIASRRPERGAILKRRWSSASPIAQTAPSPTARPKSVVRTCSAVAGAGIGMTVR